MAIKSSGVCVSLQLDLHSSKHHLPHQSNGLLSVVSPLGCANCQVRHRASLTSPSQNRVKLLIKPFNGHILPAYLVISSVLLSEGNSSAKPPHAHTLCDLITVTVQVQLP